MNILTGNTETTQLNGIIDENANIIPTCCCETCQESGADCVCTDCNCKQCCDTKNPMIKYYPGSSGNNGGAGGMGNGSAGPSGMGGGAAAAGGGA